MPGSTREPEPNGRRIDIGHTGNSPLATASATETVASPAPPAAPASSRSATRSPLIVRTTGLAEREPYLFVNVAGGAVSGAAVWDSWAAATALGCGWRAGVDTTFGSAVAGASAPGGRPLPARRKTAVPDGGGPASTRSPSTSDPSPRPTTFGVRLHFTDTSTAGTVLADIVVNGAVVGGGTVDIGAIGRRLGGSGQSARSSDRDLHGDAPAGRRIFSTSSSRRLGTTASALAGIELSRVFRRSQILARGPAMASPRALVEASFDDGATPGSTVAADVPLDAYGAATLDWPIDQTGTGVIVRGDGAVRTRRRRRRSQRATDTTSFVPTKRVLRQRPRPRDGDLFTSATGALRQFGLVAGFAAAQPRRSARDMVPGRGRHDLRGHRRLPARPGDPCSARATAAMPGRSSSSAGPAAI